MDQLSIQALRDLAASVSPLECACFGNPELLRNPASCWRDQVHRLCGKERTLDYMRDKSSSPNNPAETSCPIPPSQDTGHGRQPPWIFPPACSSRWLRSQLMSCEIGDIPRWAHSTLRITRGQQIVTALSHQVLRYFVDAARNNHDILLYTQIYNDSIHSISVLLGIKKPSVDFLLVISV